MNKQASIILITILLVISPQLVLANSSDLDTRSFSNGRIIYDVTFDESSNIVQIAAENPTDETIEGYYLLNVDGLDYNSYKFTLPPKKSKKWRENITDGLNVMADTHRVSIQTAGSGANFTFVRDYETTDPGRVPVPQIVNVEVVNGTARGAATTLVNVTVSNPSNQIYLTWIMAHTLRTDERYTSASVPPGSNRTFAVELNERRGNPVFGELRLEIQRANSPRHGLQKVEFSGEAGEETAYWNETYDRVQAPWEDDPYHYENYSVDPRKGPYGIPTTPTAYAGYAAALATVLGGIAVWRRLASAT